MNYLSKSKNPIFAPLGPFLAIFGQIYFFSKKWLHHMKHVTVSYLHTKTYRKRSNGSKDIAVWEIKRSDWSRTFKNISQEQEFSRTCGFRRKLVNHKMLRFKSFLVKTNGSFFLSKSKNPILALFWTLFVHFWSNLFFSKKWLHHMKYVMVFYHHAKKYKKRSNSSKDIAVWEIERSDWSRAFKNISQEQ